ncbi:MAG: threonine--tRNA ligase [Candidatus Harrisonbacteria bacterium CG10_big_fil_rev_8_21_14_0_10_38_8]|uniref:Threonine--tRNA ligase n=1 Tax=Candidatus Harrisonbacteria bacterium CG10_big_fil_rev_8_21_14_0_10_38_8 TaxID=1974582 RepID=A0A2M6WKS2_9BACT|nr:MAG: threonine--tRNA ligase [Candidatus Harrisonbacteria bacterium CG10_big_fil_rev_8_21_14_0_10_38_8]
MKEENIRHTLSHLLAASVKELYPDTKLTLGPAVENGFYYDMEFTSPISDTDLGRIEKKMKALLPSWKEFSSRVVSYDEALDIFKDNPYKLELVKEINDRGEEITLYTCGGFTDLCRGGHVEFPSSEISPEGFKLDKTAGAYWRGDEKNKMLTRVYGLAFSSKDELEKFIEVRAEAVKRDHRKIGKELDLFVFSELVGPGLPLWTPRGTILRNELDSYVWELRKKQGYSQVDIPHITKKELFETSGHWEKFGDELFRVKSREGHEFAMKPMNCPFHTQIFARTPHSYKDMPARYANTTKVYRDEQTGELHGISRVRSITQDDGHVFCREDQIDEEVDKIWSIVEAFYFASGFEIVPTLSIHDKDDMGKYLGSLDTWESAVSKLRSIVKKRGHEVVEAKGEAAFYGPKIDFISKDSLGRQWQVATIQLDMNMPERFNLSCINEEGEKERIFMIHTAVMGSVERFISVLIEHTYGKFPVWMNPSQVRILAVSEKFQDYAMKIADELRENNIRVEISTPNETLGKRIRKAQTDKVPYILVVGEKEVQSDTVSVRHYRDEDLGSMSKDEFTQRILKDIKMRVF